VLSGQAVAGVEVGFDPATVALVLAVVAVGGLVKGLVGFGYAVATLAGMALLDRVPGRPLALGLGLFTLAYVLLKQDRTAVPGERPLRERRLVDGRPAELGVGVVAGLVFGASNVGVQVVAYLDSLDPTGRRSSACCRRCRSGCRSSASAPPGRPDCTRAAGSCSSPSSPPFPVSPASASGSACERLPAATVETAVSLLLGVIALRLPARVFGV